MSNGFVLTGLEGELFKLLKEGPSSEILPDMVNKVAKMLKKQPSNAGKVDEILKKQIDDKIQRVDKILE